MKRFDIEKQREFFRSGATRDIGFRIEKLKRLRRMVEENRSEIIGALKEDLARPAFESYVAEISPLLLESDAAIRRTASWSRPKRVRTPSYLFLASSYIRPEPLGVALILGPWNYPVGLVLSPLIGAIAAGNCAVVKPSELAERSSRLISDMLSEYFSPEYVSVVEGGPSDAQALLEEKFDYIFFTGGRRIGKIVMEAASRNLIPITLELGGKSPCIVEGDARLDIAARRITWGKFFNAGQTCIAPDYLLVQRSIRERLLKEIGMCVREFYGERPAESPDYARIVNRSHFHRLLGLMEGGNAVIGGEVDEDSLYISPTVLDSVSKDSHLMNEEIFGPLLPVIEYGELEEAIGIVGRRPEPLAVYFFSEDRARQRRVLDETSSGGCSINDTLVHYSNFALPFGGVGGSGFGKYHGRESFDVFSNARSVLRKSTLFDSYLRYPPYDKAMGYLQRFIRFLT